jgi:hypothetical protein
VSRDLRKLAEKALSMNVWIGKPEGEAILALLEPPAGTRLVLMSDGVMDELARPREGYTVTWEWGEPDANGWYTPTFTEREDPPKDAA